jgi:oxygen-independent coproporphyrinogen-3 oxidase
MLALFPQEKPEYLSDGAVALDVAVTESRLSSGAVYAQAVTLIRRDGRAARGYARVKRDRLTDKLTTDRLLQRVIKQSFYRAAAVIVETPPVWGSLTGIRPAKLAAAALESGIGEAAAAEKLTREYYVSPERAGMCVDAARMALAQKRTLEPSDIALYIGIPFCPTRCAYCSFVSNSVEKSFGMIEPFVQALLREIEAVAETVGKLGLRIITVYIGGGTPTALPAEALGLLMQALKASFDLSHTREYTVEAGRPDTVTLQKLEIMTELGAGRVCINPQSMSADVLARIGRVHTPNDVHDAVRLVRQSGAALNMDVIAGLPGDTPDGFRQTLDTVLELKPENVTVHTLSLKKGSRIMLEYTQSPSGTDVADMLGYASRRLRESGYGPYYLYRQKFTSGGFENTGWSLPGHEGIYNICMMEELCSVLALGGGGVTKLVSASGRIERIFNAKYPREYIMQSDKITVKNAKIKDFIGQSQSAVI